MSYDFGLWIHLNLYVTSHVDDFKISGKDSGDRERLLGQRFSSKSEMNALRIIVFLIVMLNACFNQY
jgi:hypothetical protein